MKHKKMMPPELFLISLIIILILGLFVPLYAIVPVPYNLLGVLLIIFGIVLNLWTDKLFSKNKTTVKPHEIPSHFILEGPFKLTRNPMYVGMVSILLGTSIILNAASTLILVLVFFIKLNYKYIPREEANLSKKFGKEYEEFKSKTRRWL